MFFHPRKARKVQPYIHAKTYSHPLSYWIISWRADKSSIAGEKRERKKYHTRRAAAGNGSAQQTGSRTGQQAENLRGGFNSCPVRSGKATPTEISTAKRGSGHASYNA